MGYAWTKAQRRMKGTDQGEIEDWVRETSGTLDKNHFKNHLKIGSLKKDESFETTDESRKPSCD